MFAQEEVEAEGLGLKALESRSAKAQRDANLLRAWGVEFSACCILGHAWVPNCAPRFPCHQHDKGHTCS